MSSDIPTVDSVSPVPSAQGNNAESGELATDNAISEVESLRAEVQAMRDAAQKQQSALSAAIRRLEKQGKDAPAQEPKAQTAGDTAQTDSRVDARIAELEREQKKLAEERAQVQTARIRMEVHRALEDGGVPSDIADDYADLLLLRNRDELKAEYDATGKMVAAYEAYSGADRIPVGAWVSEYLQGEKGRALVAPRSAPTGGGRQNGQPPADGKRYISKAELNSLSIEELKTGNYILKD